MLESFGIILINLIKSRNVFQAKPFSRNLRCITSPYPYVTLPTHVCISFKCHIKAACDQTMRELGVDYLDMYLMHFPTGFQKVAVGTPGMKDPV